MRKPVFFANAKTKTQISFAVTAQLISAFVFDTQIHVVHFLYYLHPKFQVYSHILWVYRPVCVGPGRKPRKPVFSQRGSNTVLICCFFFTSVYYDVKMSKRARLIINAKSLSKTL